MNLLDVLLLLLVVAYALSGYWQGFVTGAFAVVGLLVGGVLGIWLAPVVLGDREIDVVGQLMKHGLVHHVPIRALGVDPPVELGLGMMVDRCSGRGHGVLGYALSARGVWRRPNLVR